MKYLPIIILVALLILAGAYGGRKVGNNADGATNYNLVNNL